MSVQVFPGFVSGSQNQGYITARSAVSLFLDLKMLLRSKFRRISCLRSLYRCRTEVSQRCRHMTSSGGISDPVASISDLFAKEWNLEVEVKPPPPSKESCSFRITDPEGPIPSGTPMKFIGSSKHNQTIGPTEDGEAPSAYYTGELLDGIPHGKGSFTTVEDDTFRGHFVQGKRCGHGIRMSRNGFYYDGIYLNNQLYGMGIMRDTGGAVYDGELKSGRRDGWGRLTSVAPVKGRPLEEYTGEWKDNMRHGYGRTVVNGAHFTGMWHNDRPHGRGRFEFPDGRIWDVVWDNGTIVRDLTVLTEPSGQVYRGRFKGSRTWKVSSFLSDHAVLYRLTGSGRIEYIRPKGAVYEGTFNRGMRHGKGAYRLSGGHVVHDGEWIHNVPIVEESAQASQHMQTAADGTQWVIHSQHRPYVVATVTMADSGVQYSGLLWPDAFWDKIGSGLHTVFDSTLLLNGAVRILDPSAEVGSNKVLYRGKIGQGIPLDPVAAHRVAKVLKMPVEARTTMAEPQPQPEREPAEAVDVLE